MNKKRKRVVRWDGEKVRALRQRLNMTQQELAEELGTRQQTISEWETEMYRPRGTSATLLNIVAERAHFRYAARGKKNEDQKR
jgi:DNA-binding transcriptional regulator YiaG